MVNSSKEETRRASIPLLDDESVNNSCPNLADVESKGACEETSTGSSSKLDKSISLLGAIGFVVGIMIGAGVFATPSLVLKKTGSVGMSLVAWLFGGVVAFFGALSYAELGTSIPKSGGEYAYLKRAYGSLLSFCFCWMRIFIQSTCTITVIGLTFAQYTAGMFKRCEQPENSEEPVCVWEKKGLALACIGAVTIVNCVSSKLAQKVQIIFTVAKLSTLVGLMILGLYSLIKNGSIMKSNMTGLFSKFKASEAAATGTVDSTKGFEKVKDFSMGIIMALFSYDGWNNINFIVEELQNPSRNLPRCIVIGIPLVTVFYMLTVFSFYAGMNASSIANTQKCATDFVVRITGSKIFDYIIPMLVAASTVGACNGGCFTNARVVYCAARNGQFPKFLSRVGKKQGTPINAILFQGLLTAAYVLLVPAGIKTSTPLKNANNEDIPGKFVYNNDIMILCYIFSCMAYVFYALTGATVLYMRYKEPNLIRPYRVPTFIPISFVIFGSYFIVMLFAESIVLTSAAIGFQLLAPIVWCYQNEKLPPFAQNSIKSFVRLMPLLAAEDQRDEQEKEDDGDAKKNTVSLKPIDE